MAKYEMSFSSQKVEGFQEIAKTIQVNKGGRKDFLIRKPNKCSGTDPREKNCDLKDNGLYLRKTDSFLFRKFLFVCEKKVQPGNEI